MKIHFQGNELSRESGSCTSWPHLQRISSYSPAMRGSRYAIRIRRIILKMLSPDTARCAHLARSSEEETFWTYVPSEWYGTVSSCIAISSPRGFAECNKLLQTAKKRRTISAAESKPAPLFSARRKENPENRHVTCYQQCIANGMSQVPLFQLFTLYHFVKDFLRKSARGHSREFRSREILHILAIINSESIIESFLVESRLGVCR